MHLDTNDSNDKHLCFRAPVQTAKGRAMALGILQLAPSRLSLLRKDASPRPWGSW